MISEYVQDFMRNIHKSGFSGVNVVEKILSDPGFSTGGSQHRILWWPKTRRIAKVSRAFHHISPKERVIIIIHYKGILRDDHNIFTKHDLAKYSSIGVRRFDYYRRAAKSKLSRILDSYEEGSK